MKEEVVVEKGDEKYKNIEGHWCNYQYRTIYIDDEVAWCGYISDVGGFEAGDYKHGMCFGDKTHIDYNTAKKLIEDIGITYEQLVLGDN